MPLFGKKTEATDKKADTKAAEKKAPVAPTAKATDRDLHSVIIKPRITEKAVKQGEQNVYTFVIRQDATKYDVRDAIKAIYNVTPKRVNIVNKEARQYMSRSKGRKVTEKGLRKAYVYLQAGDSIELA